MSPHDVEHAAMLSSMSYQHQLSIILTFDQLKGALEEKM
jgi:hypothetical protein